MSGSSDFEFYRFITKSTICKVINEFFTCKSQIVNQVLVTLCVRQGCDVVQAVSRRLIWLRRGFDLRAVHEESVMNKWHFMLSSKKPTNVLMEFNCIVTTNMLYFVRFDFENCRLFFHKYFMLSCLPLTPYNTASLNKHAQFTSRIFHQFLYGSCN